MTLSFRSTLAKVSNRLLVILTVTIAAAAGCAFAQSPPPASTSPFPGPKDFQGGFVPAPGPVVNGLQADYSGTLVVLMLDRNLVQSVLPQGASLAPTKTPSTQHPVIYLIGTQNNPLGVQNGQPTPIPGAMTYKEMSLLVPFVVLNNGANWHNLVVRMFLDNGVAVWGGNACCAYQKFPAMLDYQNQGNQSTHTISLLGTTLFQDQEALNSAFVPPWNVGRPPRFPALRKIFEMPILGYQSFFGYTQYLCTYWEWNFNNAQIASASSQFQFTTPSAPGIQGWTALGSLTNAPNGAVAI